MLPVKSKLVLILSKKIKVPNERVKPEQTMPHQGGKLGTGMSQVGLMF
jgi:hypothetical protein